MVQWKLCNASSKDILEEMTDRDSTNSSIPTTPMEAFPTTLNLPTSLRLSNDHENDDACGSSYFDNKESNVKEGPAFPADIGRASTPHRVIPPRTSHSPGSVHHVVEAADVELISTEEIRSRSNTEGAALLDKGGEPHEGNLQGGLGPGRDLPLALPEAPPAGKLKVDDVASSLRGPLLWQHALSSGDELRRLQSQVLTLEREHEESKQHEEEMAGLLVKSTIYMEELKRSLQEERRQRESAERIIQGSKLLKNGDCDEPDQSGNAEPTPVCGLPSDYVASSFGNYSEISTNTTRRKNSPRDLQDRSLTLLSSPAMGDTRRKALEAMTLKVAEVEKENVRLRHHCRTFSKKLRAARCEGETAAQAQRRAQDYIAKLENQLTEVLSANARLTESTGRALEEKVAELGQQLEVALRTRRTAEELRVLAELSLSFVLDWLQRDSSPQLDGAWGQAADEPAKFAESPGKSVEGGEGAAARAHDLNAALQISESDILSNLERPIVLTEIRANLSRIRSGKPSGLNGMAIDRKEGAEVKGFPEPREGPSGPLSNATLLSLPQCQQTVNRALTAARGAARRRRSANQAALEAFGDACVGLAVRPQWELSDALEKFSQRLWRAQERLQQAVVHRTQVGARDNAIEAQLRSELHHTQADLNHSFSRLRLLEVEKAGVEKRLGQLQDKCLLAEKMNALGSLPSELQRGVGRALRQTVSDLQDVVGVDVNILQGSFLKQIQTLALRGEAHLELIHRFLIDQHSNPSSGGIRRDGGSDDDFASARTSCVSKAPPCVSLAFPASTSCAQEGIGETNRRTPLGRNSTPHSLHHKGDPTPRPFIRETNALGETVRPTSPPPSHSLTPRQKSIYYHMKHLIHAPPSPLSASTGPSVEGHLFSRSSMATSFPAFTARRSVENGLRGEAPAAGPPQTTSSERDDWVRGAKTLAGQLANVCKLIENSTNQSADLARTIQTRIASYERNIKNALESAVSEMAELLQGGVAGVKIKR
ncbi:unnamed protein product [Phytomonas sp. Hart1]|nr:unnamed protein product [Phytomonas sp. Hart1]|eukprot:CCW71457.1 unnamed protein product [Phytomonas sp. isolate Hart1]